MINDKELEEETEMGIRVWKPGGVYKIKKIIIVKRYWRKQGEEDTCKDGRNILGRGECGH